MAVKTPTCLLTEHAQPKKAVCSQILTAECVESEVNFLASSQLKMREDEEEFPEPLPPLNEVEVLIERSPLRIRCCAKNCLDVEGTMTCSSCCAVRYCSPKCRKEHWKEHKTLCKEVKRSKEELVKLAEPLRSCQPQWSDHVIDMFQQDGRFDQQYENGVDINSAESKDYSQANSDFQSALRKCGEESCSELAFRLEAENCLNMMRLSYRGRLTEGVRTLILGSMIAGHMDQEALNYIRQGNYIYLFIMLPISSRYFVKRQTTTEALPYLHVEDQDIEAEFKLDEDECEFPMEQEEHVALCLLKLKRLQALLVERQNVSARWRTTLMGTHKRIGADSPLLKIASLTPVLLNLRGYLFGNLVQRIKRLSSGIELILKSIHEENEFVLPGILEPESIPPYDPYFVADEEAERLDWKLRTAAMAYESVGWVWCFQSPSRTEFLKHFLENGFVMDTSLKLYPTTRILMDFLNLKVDTLDKDRVTLDKGLFFVDIKQMTDIANWNMPMAANNRYNIEING